MPALPRSVLTAALDQEDRRADARLGADLERQVGQVRQRMFQGFTMPTIDQVLEGVGLGAKPADQPSPAAPEQRRSFELPGLDALLGNLAPKPQPASANPSMQSGFTPPAPASGTPAAMPQITAAGGGAAAPTGYTPSTSRGAEGVEQWSALVSEAAQAYGLPESTIKGLMEIESGGNPEAVSSAGAQGLMQVMPFHFGQGENPRDPRTNIMKGAKVYADALRRWGDPDKAAAAYFGAIDGNGNITNATDGSSVDGPTYVRLWRAAAAKYGGSAPPNAGTAPSSAPAVSLPTPAASSAPGPSQAAGDPPRITVRNRRTGLTTTISQDEWDHDVTNKADFEVVGPVAQMAAPALSLKATEEPMDEPLPGSRRLSTPAPPPMDTGTPLDMARTQGWMSPGGIDQQLDGMRELPRASLGDSVPVRDRWANEQASPEGVGPYDPDQGPRESRPYVDPDSGPREALPGSVGAQPVSPPSDIPGPDLGPGGFPIVDQPATYGPYTSETSEPQPDPFMGTGIDPSAGAASIQQVTAPARRVYSAAAEEANARQDEIDEATQPQMSEFGRAVNVPWSTLNRALRVANAVVMATPQATADTIDAALAVVGLGRDTIGLDLPVVGRIGVADIVDVGPLSNIGLGRGVGAGFGQGVAGAIERGTGAAVRGAGEAIQGAGRAVRGALDANAERVAAADARMVQEGSTMAPASLGAVPEQFGSPYPPIRGRIGDHQEAMLGADSAEMIRDSRMPRDAVHPDLRDPRMPVDDAPRAGSVNLNAAFIIPPEGSPVRARRVQGAEAPRLLPDEQTKYVTAADAVLNSRPLEPDIPVEWHDLTVRIKNKSQYDGDHAVRLPFFRNAAGELLPLAPPNMGGPGTPVNSAYQAAVKANGGRKGFPYGLWTARDGSVHPFDSPQEVLFMNHYDDLQARGEIKAWYRADNNPHADLEAIPYVSTNRDKGGVREYLPDFIVEHNDGRIEVIEAKPAKVIAGQEDYGVKGGGVTGKMGWDVSKKAAGITAALADKGVSYRLMLQRDSARMIPTGPGRTGRTAKRIDLVPGLDPRDVPEMARKTISPDENSPGNTIAEAIMRASDDAVKLARRLKARGLSDEERLAQLTRFVRDRILPTADLRNRGMNEGQVRRMPVRGQAEMPSWIRLKGRQSFDSLEEAYPEGAAILRDIENQGAIVRHIAVEQFADVPGGPTTPRLFFEGDGDPQAGIRAAAQLGQDAEGGATFWYYDEKGPYGVREVTFTPRPGAPKVDFDAIQESLNATGGGSPRLEPRYNDAGDLVAVHVIGRAADGSPVADDVVHARLTRVRSILGRFGIDMDMSRPSARAEVSDFMGEPGHAAGQREAIERSEQILGLRPVPRPERSAQRAGTGAGTGRIGADAAAEGADGVARRGARPEEDGLDDLDDDLIDEDAYSLIGVLPPGLGRFNQGTAPSTDRLSAVNRALSQGVASTLSGGVSAAAADATDPGSPQGEDESDASYAIRRARERAQRMGVGFAAGALVPGLAARGGRALARAAGKTAGADGGALATLGNVPQGQPPAVIINGKVVKASSRPPNLLEIAQAYRHSVGMLGQVGTGLMNAMGGPVSAGSGLATDVIRTGLMKGYPVPAIAEAGSLVAGLGEAARDALGTALGFVPQRVRNAPDFRPPLAERMQGPVGKAAGYAIDTPGRLATQVPDAFFGALFNRMGRRRAANELMMESGVSRLDPAGQLQEVQRLLNSPTPDEAARIDEMARSFSDELTYKGPEGYWEKVLSGPFRSPGGPTTANSPVAHQIHDLVGSFLMPFYSSIFKIHKLAATHTPGLGMVADTSKPLSERVARQLVGLGFGIWVADRAAQGLVTGPGPDDPDEKARLKANGWDEWSTYLPGLGYVKSDNLAQAAPFLKTIGAYYDARRYPGKNTQRDPLKEGDALARKMMRAFEGFPVVSAVKQIIEVAESPTKGLADIGIGAASSLVPAVVRANESSKDPYQRRVDTNAPLDDQILQSAQNRLGSIPGVGSRQDSPPALDRKGEPVPNPRYDRNPLLPAPAREVKPEDPITAEMGRYGVDLDKARDRFAFTRAGADSPDGAPGSVRVMLTPQEQQSWLRHRWQKLQESAVQAQADPRYATANEGVRRRVWENVISGAEQYADRALKSEIGRAALEERIRGAPAADPLPVRRAS